MKDLLATVHRGLESLLVKIVSLYELVVFVPVRPFHETLLARREVIPTYDSMTFFEKAVGKVTPDEPRSASDEVFHGQGKVPSPKETLFIRMNKRMTLGI